MTISYRNFGNEITEQQALAVGQYDKLFKDNNTLVKKEYYRNNVLHSITHYLQPSDIEIDIVQALTPLVEFNVIISDPKIPLGGFFASNERTYKNEE